MTAASDGVQRAAEYFRERGLARVVAEVSRAYYRNGRPAGVVALADATEAEHDGLAGLTGRKLTRGPLRVRLADLDRWLQESGFGCSLEGLLVAWSGEPLASRSGKRAAAEAERARRHEGWREMLESVEVAFPTESLAGRWLSSGPHGRSWLLGRYERLDLSALAEKRSLAQVVARAVDRLPLPEPRRLAVFASEVGGDPHAFDPGTEVGRIFTLALLDLFGAELGLTGAPAERLGAAARRQLFERVGVFPESVSSTVVAYGLAGATLWSGEPDPIVVGSRPDLLVLPLRRLLQWRAVTPGRSDVYLVENPTVFEDLVDALERASMRAEHTPVIICTAGWLNLAAWRLLELLAVGMPGCVFHYSGDFDLGGLRIAAAVRQRLKDRFRPWRLDPESYDLAVREEGGKASADELRQLAMLEASFPDLVEAMLALGRWAYQEALGALLIGDLLS